MENFAKKLKDIWFLVVVLSGIVVWYSDVNSRLKIVEAFQAQQEPMNQQIIQMNTQIQVMSANIDFIKAKVK